MNLLLFADCIALRQSSPLAITHMVPHVFYNGTYPNKPLTDETHGDFEVPCGPCFTSLTDQSPPQLLPCYLAWEVGCCQPKPPNPASLKVLLLDS